MTQQNPWPNHPQYPQQPYPANYYAHAQSAPDLRAPAKRAGILMIVLGVLTILLSMCCGGLGALLPQMMAQNPDAFRQIPAEFPVHTLQAFFVGFGVFGLLVGLTYLILGVVVRRGTMVPVVLSLVLAVLFVLGCLAMVAMSLITATSGAAGAGAGSGVESLCTFAIPLGLHVLLLVWLIQAVRNAPHVRSQADYANQYWQQHPYPSYPQQQPQQPFPATHAPFPPPPPAAPQSPPPVPQSQPDPQRPPMPPPPDFGLRNDSRDQGPGQ